MSETISTKALPEVLFRLIHTEKVKLYEAEGEIRLAPVADQSGFDYIAKLRGSLAAYPEMSVEKFMERKRVDKELEL